MTKGNGGVPKPEPTQAPFEISVASDGDTGLIHIVLEMKLAAQPCAMLIKALQGALTAVVRAKKIITPDMLGRGR